MKDFTQAAEKYASFNNPMDGYDFNSEKDAYIEGANHGYSEAMKEHRDFYKAVETYLTSENYDELEKMALFIEQKIEEFSKQQTT
jgi:hypothetical protein